MFAYNKNKELIIDPVYKATPPGRRIGKFSPESGTRAKNGKIKTIEGKTFKDILAEKLEETSYIDVKSNGQEKKISNKLSILTEIQQKSIQRRTDAVESFVNRHNIVVNHYIQNQRKIEDLSD